MAEVYEGAPVAVSGWDFAPRGLGQEEVANNVLDDVLDHIRTTTQHQQTPRSRQDRQDLEIEKRSLALACVGSARCKACAWHLVIYFNKIYNLCIFITL